MFKNLKLNDVLDEDEMSVKSWIAELIAEFVNSESRISTHWPVISKTFFTKASN